jgi:hypothetical protein
LGCSAWVGWAGLNLGARTCDVLREVTGVIIVTYEEHTPYPFTPKHGDSSDEEDRDAPSEPPPVKMDMEWDEQDEQPTRVFSATSMLLMQHRARGASAPDPSTSKDSGTRPAVRSKLPPPPPPASRPRSASPPPVPPEARLRSQPARPLPAADGGRDAWASGAPAAEGGWNAPSAFGPLPLPAAPRRAEAPASAHLAATPTLRVTLDPTLSQAATEAADPNPFAKPRPPWLVPATAGVGLFGLGIVLTRLLFAAPSTSSVVVETTPSAVEVSVDGHPVFGTNSPFSQDGLLKGEHVLVVHKSGYKDAHQRFNLQAGEAHHVGPIALEKVAVASEPPPAGVSISSTPAGASINMDGRATGLVTPAVVTALTPGVHSVQLELDGYLPTDRSLELAAGTTLELTDLALEPTPETAKALAKAERSAIRAEKVRQLYLERHGHGPAASGGSARSYEPPDRPKPEPFAAAGAFKPARGQGGSGATGTLQLNSRPWSQIYVDGTLVGHTPQMALQLKAGRHAIRLVNPDMGLEKKLSVSIKAGKTLIKVEKLSE